MSKSSSVIWGCINIGTTSKWYSTCLRYLTKCSEVPRLVVVLEVDRLDREIKKNLQEETRDQIRWIFLEHGLERIDNINNDNARNLRYLIPMIGHIARPDDLVALIEQDVLILHREWISQARELLSNNILVSAAGAYNGSESIGRKARPKPYFSVFKSEDSELITEHIKTNRGSFVTINAPDDKVIRLDKHRLISGRSHAFGTTDVAWGVHIRSGSNHTGQVDKALDTFTHMKPKALSRKVARRW